MLLRSFRARRLMGGCAPLLLLSPFAAKAESITGVCPDGSIFIVQHESQIPCRAAKEVDPLEVPPIRPHYLPNPYTWQVYNQLTDPNNPYNLIDSARQIRPRPLGMIAHRRIDPLQNLVRKNATAHHHTAVHP